MWTTKNLAQADFTWNSFEHNYVGNINLLYIFQIQRCKTRSFFKYLRLYDFLKRFKGSSQLCPSQDSAADSCPPWPYNAPGSIAYRWHSYIIDSYSIWMLATCPYGGGWLWQTWNGATALCMQENGGKNNVLLKLYHVLLLLFWLFCGTEKIEKFYLAREIRKSFFSNCMRNGNHLILNE